MIDIKKNEDIEKMRRGGKVLAEVITEVLRNVRPGISELELDKLAEKLIREKGAFPGFKKVKEYEHSICVSTNSVVVHGVPTNYKFKNGDVVGIDCGVYYKGFHTDMAETIRVKSQTPNPRLAGRQVKSQKKDEIDKFLDTGKRALEEAIEIAEVGNRIGNISKTIQDIIESGGYAVVRSLVGHGVGKKLHEEPEIPGFLAVPIAKTPKLVEGLTLAIEVIYNMGTSDVVLSRDDNWTIKTADGSVSGLFERTIVVTKEGPVTLTN